MADGLEREAQAPITDPHLAVGSWIGARSAGEGLSEQQAVVDDVVVLETTLHMPPSLRTSLGRR